MPIQKQVLNINFARGLDQKTDPWQIAPQKFLGMKNRVFNKGGRLDKRAGFDAFGKTVASPAATLTYSKVPSTLASGRMISSFIDELVLNDGLNLYSYTAGQDNWVYKGRAELCSITAQKLFANKNYNVGGDSALNSTLGINVFAWESWTDNPFTAGSLNGVQIAAVDANTNQTIYTSQLANTSSRPRCVSIGSKLYVLYYNSSATQLYYQEVTQTGLGSATALITNIDTTAPNYDVQVNNSLVYVAYNGTGSTVKVASYNSSLVNQASVSKGETATNGVGLFFDSSNNVWVPYNNGSATKAFIMDSALTTTVLAPTVVDNAAAASGVLNVTGIHDGTRAVIFYDKPGLPLLGQKGTNTTNAGYNQPAVGSTVNVVRSLIPPFSIVYVQDGGYYYCSATTDFTTQTHTLKNLGYSGNAAPAAAIAIGRLTYPTAGYQQSIVTFNTLTSGGTVGTAATFQRSTFLASKAFIANGVAHVVMGYDSPLQPTYFVGALYNTQSAVPNAAIVGKISPAEGGGLPYRSILPAINTVSSGIVQLSLPYRSGVVLRTYLNTEIPNYVLGVESLQLDFVSNDMQSSDLGKNLQIGSGVQVMYDGANVVEQGFHLYPETITIANTGGGVLDAGTYGYQIVYQWLDNQGQVHRSAPSPVASYVASAGDYLTLTIPTLRLTEKQNVTIAIYRTAANGSIYYRVDTMSTSYPISNSTTSDSVTFTDNNNDADITGNEQLYTEQEVENIAPPAANAMFEYKNRIILIPSENPYVWNYSKQVVNGSPVEFSDLFQQNTSTVGGPLVGGAKLDDKAIFFKGESIYYVTGTGPSVNGTNNDFIDPQFITADAGLLDLRSIVTTPVGIMFKSSKGIYLLDRSLQTRYIGAGVADYNSYSVRSAQLISTQNQVRFSLSNGTMLVYDYYWVDESGIGQWGVFDSLSVVSACMFGGYQTFVDSAGQVYQELPGQYLDGATGVNTYFKSGWFNLAGLQGFERAYYFYFLAKYYSAHTLTVNVYYDYDDSTPAQTVTITPTSDELEQWRVFLSKQKCESFCIEVQEAGSSGQGFTMSGIALMVGLKKGYTTIKAAKSAG